MYLALFFVFSENCTTQHAGDERSSTSERPAGWDVGQW